MRKVGWVLGIGVLSLPLVFVLWLLAAARWPKMDAITLRTPMALRSAVASTAEQNVAWDKNRRPALERVTRLDPYNSEAWSSLCTGAYGKNAGSNDVATCTTAVSLVGSAGNYNGLGNAQERAGDHCAAEESFTSAAGRNASTGHYLYVENMGRAALECGHLYASRAGFETASELEAKTLKDPDDDEDRAEEIKQDMVHDNEYLVLTLEKLHDATASRHACSAAHPQWSGCDCSLNPDGTVACHEAATKRMSPGGSNAR